MAGVFVILNVDGIVFVGLEAVGIEFPEGLCGGLEVGIECRDYGFWELEFVRSCSVGCF